MDAPETTRLFTAGLLPAGPGAAAPRVFRFTRTGDDDTTHEMQILVADDSPAPGYATYATVDAAGTPSNLNTDDGRPLRSELVIAARRASRRFADVLASCAFALAQGSFHVRPGTVLPDAVADGLGGSPRCRHALLVAPFLWPELQIVTDEGESGVTTILQAVPITTAESEYLGRRGYDALTERLDTRRADVTDPERPSVV